MNADRALSATEVLSTLNARVDELRGLGLMRVGLIGSTMRNEARPHSDIDLVVEFKDPTWHNYCAAKDYLEALFQRKVDFIIPQAVRPWWKPFLLDKVMYVEDL